ncbi:MAG: hypothetical protein A2Y15_03985 [Clostridiales bacterium GWF2_36_10]|nr:MAG: hypothetical protein A2Y15_03985 [Clostridiales bacterium GWF2_36_10]HAN20335.1 hypothetical protein [Clostridiales bacterium]
MEQARFKRRTITMEVLQTQQHKKRIRRAIFYSALFFIVTAVFLTVAFAVFFRVRNININGNERYSYEEIIAALPVKADDNLYSFKTEDVETAIKKAFPFIGNVSVTRSIPSHINIEITETDVAMYMHLARDYYLLSSELRVLDRIVDAIQIPENVIMLKASQVHRCIVGETASFIDTRSYDAITALYKNISDNNIQTKVDSIDITSRFDVYLQYENRFKVYVGDMDYSDIKMQFLVEIITDLDKRNTGTNGTIDISDYREASVELT